MERVRWLRDGTRVRAEAAVLALACVAPLWLVAELVRAFVGRLLYKTDAEFMEGGTLLAAYRLLHHLPVYTPPGSGFMPFVYTPLLTGVLAALGAVFGLTFTMGRAVSIVAISVTCVLLARAASSASAPRTRWFWVVSSVGLVAAGYPLTGGAYDLVRVDSLALALAVMAAAVAGAALERPSRSRWVVLTALLVATVYTKQNHAAFVAWILIFVATKRPKAAAAVALSVVAASATLLALFQWATHGNFWHYTGKTLSEHAVVLGNVLRGATMLAAFAPYWPVLALVAALLARKRRLSQKTLLWFGMSACGVAIASITFGKVSASINNFIPAVVLMGPAAVAVAGDAFAAVRSEERRSGVRAAGAVAIAVYLFCRSFHAAPYTADAEHRASVDRLQAFVSRLHGGVLFPMRPMTAIFSGQRIEQVHAMSWFDLEFTGEGGFSFRNFLARRHPAWVILTGEEPAIVVEAMAGNYVLVAETPENTWKTDVLPYGTNHPDLVFVQDHGDPPHTRCVFDFESGTYDGWRVEGAAFGRAPVRFTARDGHPPLLGIQGVVVGADGDFVASSAASPGGDAAVGAIESPEFLLDGATVALRVGGAATNAERVELRVDGVVLRVASGFGGSYLRDVHWDVTREQGKRATIRVVDEASNWNARVLLDRVRIIGSDSLDGWCKSPR